MNQDAFYVVARESGQERHDLPTWADSHPGNISFDSHPLHATTRRDIPEVPGSFHLLNVLTENECAQFISITDELGFHLDAPVSLPHKRET